LRKERGRGKGTKRRKWPTTQTFTLPSYAPANSLEIHVNVCMIQREDRETEGEGRRSRGGIEKNHFRWTGYTLRPFVFQVGMVRGGGPLENLHVKIRKAGANWEKPKT